MHHCGQGSAPPQMFSVKDSLLGSAVRYQKPILINNALNLDAQADSLGLMSILAVPLIINEEVIGVLDAVNKPGGFSENDSEFLELLTNQALVAIEKARLYESARHLAVLEERQRLARELHDSVNQQLYGITLYAETASRQLAKGNLEAVQNNLDILSETAKQALQEMRLMIFELRPPQANQNDIQQALEERLKSVEQRSGLEIGLKVRLTSKLPQHLSESLYRIAQEALNNIVKHAHASQVTVHLIQSGKTLLLRIEDDGCGFNVEEARAAGGVGFKSMQERAEAIKGDLSLTSHPGEGTIILVKLKL